MSKTPKLPLTDDERSRLMMGKVKLREIHEMSVVRLSTLLTVSEERAKELRGLAEFQQIPSIGYQLADKLVHVLGIFSLEELKGADPAKLLNRLEAGLGCWTDPCVEDQIRCVVHHADHPGSGKQWFDFTEERKRFREENGYPVTRPEVPWYE